MGRKTKKVAVSKTVLAARQKSIVATVHKQFGKTVAAAVKVALYQALLPKVLLAPWQFVSKELYGRRTASNCFDLWPADRRIGDGEYSADQPLTSAPSDMVIPAYGNRLPREATLGRVVIAIGHAALQGPAGAVGNSADAPMYLRTEAHSGVHLIMGEGPKANLDAYNEYGSLYLCREGFRLAFNSGAVNDLESLCIDLSEDWDALRQRDFYKQHIPNVACAHCLDFGSVIPIRLFWVPGSHEVGRGAKAVLLHAGPEDYASPKKATKRKAAKKATKRKARR